jgi:hypothetical protein
VVGQGGAPLADVLVAAVARDSTVATARSTLLGIYQLRGLPPGRYELRFSRIGSQPATRSPVQVGDETTRVEDVVLDPLPVRLAGVDVRDRPVCNVNERDATVLVQMWNRARATVPPDHPESRVATFEAHVLRIEGRADATGYYAPDTVGSSVVVLDSLRGRESIVDSLIGRTPAETLETIGFVHRNARGVVVDEVPGLQALLSEAFVRRHCFRGATPSSTHPELIGIAFTPSERREALVDVAGILWLDRSSLEPRRVEFDYTNVAAGRYTLCDAEAQASADRMCLDFDESGANRFGIGGDADFRRLPTGDWAMVRWTSRAISTEMRFATSPRPRGKRFLMPKESSCSSPKRGVAPRRGDCVSMLWPLPRLRIVTSILAEAWRDGIEVYGDSRARAAIRGIERTQAGPRPAFVAGTLTDTGGHPLRNAIVHADSLGRIARTDSLGKFRLQLAPGMVTLSIRCRGWQSVRLTISVLPDSTRHLSGTLRPESPLTNVGTDCSRWQ